MGRPASGLLIILTHFTCSLFRLPNKLMMGTLKDFQRESHYELHVLSHQSIVLSFLHGKGEREKGLRKKNSFQFLISPSPALALTESLELAQSLSLHRVASGLGPHLSEPHLHNALPSTLSAHHSADHMRNSCSFYKTVSHPGAGVQHGARKTKR